MGACGPTRQGEETLKPFEIWWATLPDPVGRRPVLLLSRAQAYSYLQRVMVAEITTTVRSIPVEVPVGTREGLSRQSVINLDNLHVVSISRLVTRAGELAAGRRAEVKRALGHALGWPELTAL